VLLSKVAAAQLQNLERPLAKRVKSHLFLLEENPFAPRSGADIRQLESPGGPKFYRLRVGEYRAVYVVVENEVRITEILHRKKAYRFLD